MQTLAPAFSVTRDDRHREIHWSVAGFWGNEDVVAFSQKLLEVSKPFRDDSQNFKALGDISDFAVQSAAMAEHIRNTQSVSASVGVKKLAVLFKTTLVKQQFRRVSEALDCQFFTDRDEALKWLRS